MSQAYINQTENQIDVKITREISRFSLETIKEKLKEDSEKLDLSGNTAQLQTIKND